MSKLETKLLRILILEDTDSDAELVEHELRKAGIQFATTRVICKEDFLNEVTNRPPDIILSDYSLPQFSGIEALRLVNAHGCQSPFILVTGSQTEEVAVECMKEGAADYILKSSLTRLPSALVGALKRREAEKEKAEALEALRQSQEQLLQSQKLEAVGQLAGGIAHDFNNLLTAIMGYSQLGLSGLADGDPMQRNLGEIKKASERAASLTRQLLAFSRKQVLQPKVLDLNSVVPDMERMLRRLIGEDIGLRTALQPDLGRVKADPGQMEQVIMNLAVNGRDAMPSGGKLTLETANVSLDENYARQHVGVVPGAYVMLAVSDTGIGMDDETQQHVFDPFFTTKEIGKGTGLGLSTVYGIVKQSGGSIWVYSEVGKGTTFKVYLPRVDERAERYKHAEILADAPLGSETILLVEDADMLRRLAKEVLETSGYRVLEAATGRDAMRIVQENSETIQLLLTDVVMPEMSGRELANRIAPVRPEMRVLYMSGYTNDAIVHHGVLDEGINFIQKPFSPDALTLKVREALGSA
jgi:two-component system, cell cycle sensor histidine kinase and response regulator CckA